MPPTLPPSRECLTEAAVAHRGVLHSLLVKPDHAKSAAIQGNLRAKAGHLRAFGNEVAAQSAFVGGIA